MVYKYPNSISEAAKLLDTVKPDWYNIISTNKLDMTNVNLCILGQLYNNYYTGMKNLFGEQYRQYKFDDIFGGNADKANWLQEINDRKAKQMDFITALREVKAGKKVKVIGENIELWAAGEIVCQTGKSSANLLALLDKKFELVKPVPVFSSLKFGQKFKNYPNGVFVWTKVVRTQDRNCLNTETFELGCCSENQQVEIIE